MVPMPIERSRVPAGLLVAHHDGDAFRWVEIVARLVEQRFRLGFEHARDEARAHLRAAGIAAGGVERETRDGLSVAHTSVITATTDVVISEKSIEEFFSVEFSATEVSRMSVMRMDASSFRGRQAEPGIHNHRKAIGTASFHRKLVVMDPGLALGAPRDDGRR